MNAYTAALLALQTERQWYRRQEVESLVKYIEHMREQNADLRLQLTHWELSQDEELNKQLDEILFTDGSLPAVIETGELEWIKQ